MVRYEMGLLDKISKSLVDYVSLADLVGFLSEYQNETIHSIALYLSHYNFYDTPNYSITVDNKFYENDLDNFGNEIHWIEPKNIIDNLIKEFVFFDTTVSRGMMAEMTFSKIRHYLSKMDGVEINNKQYLAIEKLYRANVHYKKSDLLELDFLAEYLQDNQEFKEWKTSYIRPFSYYDNQWYITEPANQPTDLQQENERLQARIAELESQSDDKELTDKSKDAISKLVYALMMNSDFQLDGTKKGNLNNRLVSLTNEKGVPVTEKFIADWLEYLNDKYYFKKGR